MKDAFSMWVELANDAFGECCVVIFVEEEERMGNVVGELE
jgi:hypothetical protein